MYNNEEYFIWFGEGMKCSINRESQWEPSNFNLRKFFTRKKQLVNKLILLIFHESSLDLICFYLVVHSDAKHVIWQIWIMLQTLTLPPSALYTFSSVSSSRASPKSVILMWFGDFTRTLRAARSLCTSRLSSRYIIPCQRGDLSASIQNH